MIAAFVDVDGTLRPSAKKDALFPHAIDMLQLLNKLNVDIFVTTNNTLGHFGYNPEEIY